MRLLKSPPSIASLLLVVAALARFQSQGGSRHVSDLSIELKPLRPRVVVQESLPVTTILINHRTTVVTAPAADGPSPFVYELRPTQKNRDARIVSQQRALEATSPGTPQPDVPLPFNVGPGASVPRIDDLAEMAVKPFAPATYLITASVDTPVAAGPSAPAQVQVVPPRPIVQTTAIEPTFDRRIAFVNADDDGTFGILWLHSSTQKQESAVFLRVNATERFPKPDSIAVGVPTDAVMLTRWVAWTSSGRLFATGEWRSGPTPQAILRAALPSSTGHLLSPGYFFADGSGLFFVLDGANLHAYRANEGGLSLAWSAPVGIGNAERVRLRYAGSSRGEGILQLLAISGSGGNRQLLLQAWNVRDGSKAQNPTALAQIHLPVVAWFLPVSGKARNDRLYAIDGPAADGSFHCESFGLQRNSTPGPMHSLRLSAPPSGEWAITVAGNGNVIVAARMQDGRLQALSLPGSDWRTIAEHVAPGYLDVFADHDRAWAEWLEPEFGFRRVKFRAD